MATEKLLSIDDLSVNFDTPSGVVEAVRHISFDIGKGETVALVGESGSGKSATALSVLQLLPYPVARHPSGAVRLQGDEVMGTDETALRDIRGNRISMIFQEPMSSLNPLHTVHKQIAETLILHKGMSEIEARARVLQLLKLVGLVNAEQRLTAYPHELSGGQRQRVMIAMALMCEPKLLIADEPTTALDVTIQAQILLLIQSVQKEFKIGVILITHDLGVVARVADRVAVMYAGQIVETGTATEVFEKPLHPYTQGLIDCIPIPGKTKAGEQLGSIPGIVPNLVGDLSGCSFRDRCDFAQNECAGDVSENVLGAGRQFRCILPEELGSRQKLSAEQ